MATSLVLMMLASPMFAAGLLTIVLVAYLLIDGIFEVIGALQIKPAEGWGWMLLGGSVSLILDIMLWGQFPLAGMWAIGVLLSIKLALTGVIMITVGSTARSMGKMAEV